MKKNVYAELTISPSSGYLIIEDAVLEIEINESYEEMKQNSFNFLRTKKKIECFEGYKLKYILIEVTFDGRKGIKKDDILNSLESKGLASKRGSSIFGGMYLPSESLKNKLNEQYSKRKELVKNGLFEYTA
jgi:lambda repressor-like predicted transcriptional regulator